MKRFFMLLFAMVMIPYVTTLAWTGRIRTDVGESIPTEEFLVGMVAAEIPAEYGIETMKAQAVLARTYVYRIVDPGIGGENTDDPGSADPGTDSGAGAAGWGKRSRTLDRDLMEEELDIDCLSVREMEKKWGNEHFEEYYEKVRRAVRETEGLVAEYDGELIEPFYCLASAGKTRELAAYPYLLLWRVRGIWKRMDFYMSGRSRKASLRTGSGGSADRSRLRTGSRRRSRSSSGTAPDM